MQLTGKCSKNFRSEFKVKNLGFEYEHLEEFYQSQWQSGETSWVFLLYRWIWASFFTSVLLSCLILQFSDGKFFIFLTNWGILLCMFTQLCGVVLVTRWHYDIDGIRSRCYEYAGRHRQTPTLIKLYWLLHNVALPLALVITTIYWSFLHGKMNKPNRYPVMSFVTHCLNSVFMLVDFVVVGFPLRIVHTVYAMLLPIIFCGFTVIYFLCGGTDEYGNHYVYPLLDWTVPSRGILTFAGVFLLYCIFGILLYLLFKLKRYVHHSLTVVWSPHCVGLI